MFKIQIVKYLIYLYLIIRITTYFIHYRKLLELQLG